jgi:hypothetical protein
MMFVIGDTILVELLTMIQSNTLIAGGVDKVINKLLLPAVRR